MIALVITPDAKIGSDTRLSNGKFNSRKRNDPQLKPHTDSSGVGEAAETNKKSGGALLDTDIAICNTCNSWNSIIRRASVKGQSFRCVPKVLDRRALLTCNIM
jgi:hypothetical protein